MCKDEGTRGGDGMAEAAFCGIGGQGRGRLCLWFRDDLHGNGAAVFADELSAAVDSGMGGINGMVW